MSATTLDAGSGDVKRGRLDRWLTHIGDGANPLVVRQVRRQMRSRGYIITFIGLIGLCLLVSIAQILDNMSIRSNEAGGRELLIMLASLWSFASWVVAPIGLLRSLASERESASWDLVVMTGMSPWRVASGLLGASLLQHLTYASAIAPFIALAYLMRGSDIGSVLVLMAAIPLGGLTFSSLAIAMGALGAKPLVRSALSALMGMTVVGFWFAGMPLWAELTGGWIFGSSAEFWLATSITANFGLAATAVFLVFAATLFAPVSSNRSTLPRLALWGIWFNVVLWFVIWGATDGTLAEATLVLGLLLTPAVCIYGLFAALEDDGLSLRQSRSLRGGVVRRLAMTVLGPGGGRGRLGHLLMAGLTLLFPLIAWFVGDRNAHFGDRSLFAGAIVIVAYNLIYLAFVDIVHRGALAGFFPGAMGRRGLVFILLIIALIFGLVASVAGIDASLLLFSPFHGLFAVMDDNGHFNAALITITVGGAAAAFWLLMRGLNSLRVPEPGASRP